MKTTVRLTIFALLAALVFSACGGSAPTQVTAPSDAPEPTAALVTPTATAVPPRALVICVGQEPTTLYRYGSSARSMWAVLEALYDGPIDTVNFQPQPVILSNLPAVEYEAVAVEAGSEVMDTGGNLAVLSTGTLVRPAGCTSAECAQAWDGQSALQMDQPVLRFQMLSDLTWSDGEPLKASDSVYAFNLAADPDTPVSKRLINQTASYTALDEVTVEWRGLPGFQPVQPADFFWSPLPEHAWSSLSAAELLTADESTRRPLGWGPYIIQDWIPGDHLTLQRNPAYFRAAEGLPYFDTLVYRFVGEQPDSTLNAVLAGECDLVDGSALLETQLARVQELVGRGLITAQVGQGPEWEHLDFGIRPAAYDLNDGPTAERPDFFSDVRVRQAFAYCMDRATLVNTLLMSFGQVANNFLSPNHPAYAAGLPQYSFDPAAGMALLDQAGWVDDDANPTTARVAAGAVGVPAGTPLAVEYLTTEASQRQAAAEQFAINLGQCGIAVTPRIVSSAELYAAGPEGPLFGRSFDLAQYAWQSSLVSPCFLYTSDQIPAADNEWLRVNVTGYANPDYDAACASALSGNPVDPAAQAAVQSLFMQELPVIPLYYHLKVLAARPDLCGLSVDVSARSELFQIEQLDYGDACPLP